MDTITDFPHPTLGIVRGWTSPSTRQFLGLRYATLTGKWAPPVISEGDPKGIVDATTLGPSVPSPPNGIDIEFSRIQRPLPHPELQQSDVECLNLNITTPKAVSAGVNLPVIVFIHGGGFAIGANSWPQYDFRRLIELSVREQQPVIGVNINYRLGALGFLTSKELVSHGYKQNNGLLDQRTALLWIKRHIVGFGGNPDDMTIVGQSAGGGLLYPRLRYKPWVDTGAVVLVSATHHLQSEVPLFKRMVSMSGTNLLLKPLPEQVTECTYKAIVARLGLASWPATERVNALVQMDTQKLLQASSPTDALLPAVGGKLGLNPHTYAGFHQGSSGSLNIPGRKWCEEIMIGDCQMDASILSTMLNQEKEGIASAFRESLTRSLGSADKAKQVLAAYAITEDIPGDDAFEAILRFANDISFFIPVLNYGQCWSGKAFIYHFNEPNSWDGPWKGYATHILDVSYLFQNYNEALSEPQRAVASQFALDLIAFSSGCAPWPKFKWETKDLHARLYGGKGADTSGKVATVLIPHSSTERSGTIFNLTRSIPADDLSRAWGIFMAGH
ncbi:unnamed protein product [Penicillium egyptiacum]|uniref:Carboxylic ester hydrolase n=1 Tax=Penicillium egyptiacum TaxID=1303716 RepID=A0A9W4KPF7_9EURO|nr:unnamed protein product [Penicillium egyptiacum]